MPARIPEDLPILSAAARRPERLDAALELLRDGFRNGEIRKARLDEAKTTLSRVVEKAWDNEVREPFFHAGRFRDQPDDVQDLDNDITMYSLHSVLSAAKKLQRSTAGGPAVDAMRAVMTEALPVAQAVRDLGPMIVKGRAPAAAPAAPANPDKVTGTCSCCFRGIAVTGEGRMAHHGYKRPGGGYQTSSCSGRSFPPLETSTEGLEWLIGVMRDRIGRNVDRLGRADDLERIRYTVRRGVEEEVTPDDPGWERQLRRYKAQMSSEIRMDGKYLEQLEEELPKWQGRPAPEEPEAGPEEMQP